MSGLVCGRVVALCDAIVHQAYLRGVTGMALTAHLNVTLQAGDVSAVCRMDYLQGNNLETIFFFYKKICGIMVWLVDGAKAIVMYYKGVCR